MPPGGGPRPAAAFGGIIGSNMSGNIGAVPAGSPGVGMPGCGRGGGGGTCGVRTIGRSAVNGRNYGSGRRRDLRKIIKIVQKKYKRTEPGGGGIRGGAPGGGLGLRDKHSDRTLLAH